MNRRLLVLSSVVLVSSGALIFACSSGDDTTDSGTDAAPGKDATTDTGKQDSTTNDVTTNDVTTNDASDSGTADSPSDAPVDAPASDAGTGTFMVVRAGGAVDAGADAALTAVGQPVYLEERNISDGSLVRTIAMPVVASGFNQPFVISGSSTSEGALTTSADGHYVVMGGYAAIPGTAAVSSTTIFDGGTLRVVARVDKSGNVDTTTELQAFDKGSIRGATTDDGGSFWATGTSTTADAGLGGAQYALLGSTGTVVNITAVPSNARTSAIFGGQLFIASGSQPFIGVSSVGTGEPTTTGQTSTSIVNFGDAGSPYGFSLLDLDASVTGLDTLYVADDSTTGAGIQKWVNTGSGWTKVATFTFGTGGFRGVMAMPSGGNVIVIGTTDSASPNQIVKFVDDGTTTPTGASLATSPTNTIFRGIALAPQ